MTDGTSDNPDRQPVWMDAVEKAKLERLKLYFTHKAHGSLGTFYEMFPDEKDAWPARERRRSHDRER